MSKTAGEILKDAADLIDTRGKERDKDDGERSMERCVKSFNAMTGHNLTETEGWKFMMFLKMARMEGGSYKFDDYEDNVSYSALMAESSIKENITLSLHEWTASELMKPGPVVFNPTLAGPDKWQIDGSKFVGFDLAKPGGDTTAISEYDDIDQCPKCLAANVITERVTENGVVYEADTLCSAIGCKHEDYWAHGHFQSKSEKS